MRYQLEKFRWGLIVVDKIDELKDLLIARMADLDLSDEQTSGLAEDIIEVLATAPRGVRLALVQRLLPEISQG